MIQKQIGIPAVATWYLVEGLDKYEIWPVRLEILNKLNSKQLLIPSCALL